MATTRISIAAACATKINLRGDLNVVWGKPALFLIRGRGELGQGLDREAID
jgi:hypothetical protein